MYHHITMSQLPSSHKSQSATAHMINYDILKQSRLILKEYPLCDSCLGRMYVKKLYLKSSKILGKKIKDQIGHTKRSRCFICQDLMNNLTPYIQQLVDISKNVQYTTFLIGVVLKPSTLDRDDHIRSRFQMMGIESIKSKIARSLTASFSKKLCYLSRETTRHLDHTLSSHMPKKKRVDYVNPDVTFLVNFKTGTSHIRAKSLFVCGRYTKHVRGLTQKQKPCSDCLGKGCIFCNYHGITQFNTSVEGIIANYLYKEYGCIQAKFTWVGGEDKNSLVNGAGRLFFAQLFDPKKRSFKKTSKPINLLNSAIQLFDIHTTKRIPLNPITFYSKTSLYIKTSPNFLPPQLSSLKILVKSPLLISSNNDSKHTTRRIYKLGYKRLSPDSFLLNIMADGGIPLKKLVGNTTEHLNRNSLNSVTPNISEILGTRCICTKFDFDDILINKKDLLMIRAQRHCH